MPRNKNHDDLPSGDINLLPEDMRHVEVAARGAAGSPEKVYQLRSPKKAQKQSFWSRMPFFGGSHWEAGASAPTPPQPTPLRAVTGVTQGANTDVIPPSAPRADEFAAHDGPARVMPGVSKISKVRKNPFARLFSRSSAPSVPAFAGGVPSAHVGRAPSVDSANARHYSLLESSGAKHDSPAYDSRAAASRGGASYGASVSSGLPSISRTVASPLESIPPTEHTVGYGMPGGTGFGGRGHAAAPGKKPGSGFPRWLNPFYLIGLLFRRNKKHPHAPATSGSAVAAQASVAPSPAQPPAPSAPRPLVTPVTSGVASGTVATTPPIRPIVEDITPPASQPAAPTPNAPVTPSLNARPSFAGHSIPSLESRSFETPAPPAPPVPQPSSDTAPLPRGAQSETPVQPITPQPDASRPETQHARSAHGGISGMVTRMKGLRLLMPRPHAGADEEVPEASLVNLISGQFQSLRSWQMLTRMMIIAGVSAIGVAAMVYGGLELWKQQLLAESSALDEKIERFRNDLVVYANAEEEMRTLTSYIDIVETLMARHIYWTDFFALLEKHTLPDVFYDGLAATTNGTLTLSAHGSSFETVSKILKHLNSPDAKEFVSSASIMSAQRAGENGATEVHFSIELVLNPNLFYYGTSTEN